MHSSLCFLHDWDEEEGDYLLIAEDLEEGEDVEDDENKTGNKSIDKEVGAQQVKLHIHGVQAQVCRLKRRMVR